MRMRGVGSSVVMIAVILGYSLGASAALVQGDWKASGDGLLTYDAGTGLEWLDVTVSVGDNIEAVEAKLSPGGAYEGFRIARLGDVEMLFDHAGLQETAGPAVPAFDAPGVAAVQAFLGLVGIITVDTIPTQTSYRSYVMYDEPLGQPYAVYSLVEWFDAFNPGYRVSLNAGGIDRSLGDASQVGTFLMRDAPPVPIPGALWLLGSALAALAATGIARRGRGGVT